MGTVEQIFALPKDGVDVAWTCLKEFEKTEDGQLIVLGRSVDRAGNVHYGVLIMSGVDLTAEGFDIIAEFPGTAEGRAAAEFAADIADKTLASSCLLLPEPEAA